MESLKEIPYLLEYPPDALYEIRKRFDLERPGRMTEAIGILEAWIQQQEHFVSKNFDRNYLETLIIACKGSLEKAKKKIDKLCTMRTFAPEYFISDPTSLKRDITRVCQFSILPKLTADYYKIIVAKMLPGELTADDHLTIAKDWIFNGEYLFRAGFYNLGVIIIIDFREGNMKDVLVAFNLNVLRKYITIVQEGYGIRLKAIHFLSNSKLINNLIAFIKPFLSEKLAGRIYAHDSIESLHKEVPKECLCEDLGGDGQPLSMIQDLRLKLVNSREHIEYVKEVVKQKTDESKRIDAKIDVDLLQGTFRSLNVD